MKTEGSSSSSRKKTSYQSIKNSLRSADGRFCSSPIGNRRKPVKKNKKPENPTHLVEETLLQLISEGTSDAARVSAAKALMNLVKYMNEQNDRTSKRHNDPERDAAIAEARALLAQFAALKLGRSASASVVGMEQQGKVDIALEDGATDSGGQLENMADTGRARLGKDQDRR